jgi:nucleoside-diphosphate-sugar epimerase
MRVLVTGHRGYIGPHLVDVLKQQGHHVCGVDLNLFEGCEWSGAVRADVERTLDFRQLTHADLDGYDVVCHLAAISNDPMGDLDEELTSRVNGDGSVELARKCKHAGVGRFLFSGSCSIYGAGETLDLDESASFNPLSAYARSKVFTEHGVLPLADDGFTVAVLRNATAYGASPMLRIDLVVNNLLGCAVAKGAIRIMSDGEPWRPLIHCRDIANAFAAFVAADSATINRAAVNVGANEENYQVKDVASLVQELVPSARIEFTGEIGPDPRNYRVKFDRLNAMLPDFKLSYTLRAGMEELHRQLVDKGFSAADFDGDKYVRLRTLKRRLDRFAEPVQSA